MWLWLNTKDDPDIVLERQRAEKRKQNIRLHKICVLTVGLLITYQCFTQSRVTVKDPQFTLLGPHNATEPTPIHDNYEQLINISNFAFIKNPQVCSNSSQMLILIIVPSNPDHFVNRRMIRFSWAKADDAIKLVFLLGQTNNSQLVTAIDEESDKFQDIVQGNFVDVYSNMTYKHVMGLKWVSHHCPKAKYVLKTDDDVVVNIYRLVRFLARELSPWGADDLILCPVLENSPVQRSYRSKWRVSPMEYSEAYYPTYCAGWAILYSQDVVRRLLKAAQNAPYFWIDDVHITGFIAEELGIPRTTFGNLKLNAVEAKLILTLGLRYSKSFIFSTPDLDTDTMMTIWLYIERTKKVIIDTASLQMAVDTFRGLLRG